LPKSNKNYFSHIFLTDVRHLKDLNPHWYSSSAILLLKEKWNTPYMDEKFLGCQDPISKHPWGTGKTAFVQFMSLSQK